MEFHGQCIANYVLESAVRQYGRLS